MFGIGHWEILIVLVLGLLGSLFWLWMLVECALKEPKTIEKLVWVIIIAVTLWLGAAIYFFARRPKRIREQNQLPPSWNAGAHRVLHAAHDLAQVSARRSDAGRGLGLPAHVKLIRGERCVVGDELLRWAGQLQLPQLVLHADLPS
jgi:hypothetical protein